MGSWRFRAATVILIGIIALGATGVWVSHRGADTLDISDIPTETVAPPNDPVTLEQAFATANGRARQWSDQPIVFFASLQTDWPVDTTEQPSGGLPAGGWARFAFLDGAGKKNELLSVVIQRYSNEIADESVQPWPGRGGVSLPVSVTPVTSAQAIAIAEDDGGRDFRTACVSSRHEIQAVLVRLDGEPVVSPGTESESEAATAASTPFGGTPAGATPIGVPRGQGTPILATPAAEAPGMGGDQRFAWIVTYSDTTIAPAIALTYTIDAETGDVEDRAEVPTSCPSG